jgi:hypothetical protein
MRHYQTIGFFVVIILMAIGIISFQYRFYHTSVATTTPSSIADQIISGGPPLDGIPAIDKPLYESVAAADQYLDDDGYGLVVERGGRYRFYPFQILVWHMIVNDTFNGDPLLVTYDPLSETANVFERFVGGESLVFSVSGKLYNSNLLMADSLGNSLWSQLRGQAMTGDKTDDVLTRVPSHITTWKQFKRLYPVAQILSRETGVTRDYTYNPYALYQSSHAVWFPVSHQDDRFDAKSLVFGFDAVSEQKAYVKDQLQDAGVINDQVGEKAIVVFWDRRQQTARGYRRTIQDGSLLTFREDDERLIDEQTDSVWNVDGEAVSGSHRGERLEPIVLQPSYWFVWVAMYPGTTL